MTLCFYAAGLERGKRSYLLAGSLTASLAIYTRQPGIILPVVPLTGLLLEALWRKKLPPVTIVLILLLPYVAFLPLSLFFYRHSGSFLMYVTKPWEHSFKIFDINVLLWSVNFIGFFSAPFFYHLLRGHWNILTKYKKIPIIVCLLLSPWILLGSETIASQAGGLGRIFSTLHIPAFLVSMIVVVCQFLGLLTLTILGLHAWSGTRVDRMFFLFSIFYMAGISTKGGNLLVHYAAPLIFPAAWACATACRRDYAGRRTGFLLAVFCFALFGTVWSKAESELGDSIYRAVQYIKETRNEGDLTYTWSSTATQLIVRNRLTFGLDKADNGLLTPEDPTIVALPEHFQIVKVFKANLFGLPLGKVYVFRKNVP